ncbi:hypothetical protein LguiA_020667 [Lonicera macranthoides]
MASSNSKNEQSENSDGFAMTDEILMCNAWKQVTHDGKWCERDNPQTWVKMAEFFNEAPKKEDSLWKDRVVTPDQVAQLWAKVEPAVKKFNCFYNEKEMLTPHQYYQQYIGSKRVRKTWWRKVMVTWVLFWILLSFWVFWYISSQAVEKRKETLASMCDERARMLQDQFNVSMNHVQAMHVHSHFNLSLWAKPFLLLIRHRRPQNSLCFTLR